MKIMTGLLLTLAVACAVGSLDSYAQQPEKGRKKILFYSQSCGWRHPVVARPMTGELSLAERVFKEFVTKAGYEVFVSQDHNDLKDESQFKHFDAIALYTTHSPPLNRDALAKWLREGGALIGIHCATDTFYDWPEYGKIMGAYFRVHGGNSKTVTLKVENTGHPATKMLGQEWVIADEIYQFKPESFSRDKVRVLLSVDTSNMSEENLKDHKMKAGEDYPIAWTNTEGRGRVFYTALGHREDVWTNAMFQQHLLGGIAWALGQAEPQ